MAGNEKKGTPHKSSPTCAASLLLRLVHRQRLGQNHLDQPHCTLHHARQDDGIAPVAPTALLFGLRLDRRDELIDRILDWRQHLIDDGCRYTLLELLRHLVDVQMSQQHYEPEFKQQIVRLHIEEGRTYRSLTAEYGVSKASICKWCKEFSEECQENASKNPTAQNDLELMKENRRLREELAEARKENLFLKKAAAFFAKGID